ncbi:MAG: SDR family NAD(P)-dependent oxidoreductase [Gemmatimonadota bacterium]|nr:SDR family NAD(P)-dependent oxidoreductase [Gemmatimonadota bacterium]
MSDGVSRTALVTGATGGIGEAIVRRLVADGFRVFAAGRRRGRLERLAEEVGGVALAFDVTEEAEVEGARRVLSEANARVDVLVNAAGVFDLSPVTETSEAVLNRNLDANLRGAFSVTRAFLPAMLAAGSGLVIQVGSVAGWRAFPENGAYSASKYGLRGFHEVLLEEIRGTGVRACLLEPGAVDTPIWDPLAPDCSPYLPSRGEMLRPDDVARAVSFVAGLPDPVAVPLLRIERA